MNTMKTITLTDTEATITNIESRDYGTLVELEWSGPDDHTIRDFDLSKLGKFDGKATSSGSTLRRGWVIIEGDCALSEWDTIPLAA
jgi:hypothetical protein